MTVLIEDCEFANTPGDGIFISSAIEATINCCKSEGCVRGAVTIDGGQANVYVNGWESLPHWVKTTNGATMVSDAFNHELFEKRAWRFQNFVTVTDCSFSNVQTAASRNEKITFDEVTIKIPIADDNNHFVLLPDQKPGPQPDPVRLLPNYQAAIIANDRSRITFRNFNTPYGGMRIRRPGTILIDGGRCEFYDIEWRDRWYDPGPDAQITIANHEIFGHIDVPVFEKSAIYTKSYRNEAFRGSLRLVNVRHKHVLHLAHTDTDYVLTDPRIGNPTDPTAIVVATPDKPVTVRTLKPGRNNVRHDIYIETDKWSVDER
ncbi:MAG: hypothetical protein AAF570_00990 [Bacteroidota bacterium]